MVDQLLGGLFGSQQDDDDDRRKGRAQDFVSRYDTGSPFEGYSMDEAVHNYQNVTKNLSPQDYEEAAAQSFQKMSPTERQQFAQMMQQRGATTNVTDDPRDLAKTASRFRQQDSGGGGLASLFGLGGSSSGGGGDLLSAARGGNSGGGGGGGMGDMMSNPLAKAALGGIAAMAMKKMFK